MKYSELISFSPIESTIQLKESNRTAAESARLVKTYVMSDAMAQNLQAPVIDQLQMDEVVDNKGVLVIFPAAWTAREPERSEDRE